MKFWLLSSLVLVVAVSTVFVVAGCASASRVPLATPDRVDLERFMGTWFVVGYTPLGVDAAAHNAIEHYHLDDEGRIKTTYQFRKGGFGGDLTTLNPVGEVYDEETNAEWRMQFIWPFKAAYVILHVSPDYEETIIAHPNRKYAWIMTRSPDVSEGRYEALLEILEEEDFEISSIQQLPHDWSRDSERLTRIREIGSGPFEGE